MRNKRIGAPTWVYAAVIFVTAVFQSTLGARIGLFGTTPSLLLCLVAGAAFFDGEKTAMLVGLAAGFFADALGGVGVSVLPLAYCLAGWLIAAAARHSAHDKFAPFGIRYLRYLLWLAVSAAFGAVVTALCLLLTAGRVNVITLAVGLLIPEFLGTMLWGLPIGLIFSLCRLGHAENNLRK